MRILLITIGLISFCITSNAQDNPLNPKVPPSINVDFGIFKIGSTMLGSPISTTDPFHAELTKRDSYGSGGDGIIIGTKNGLLDSAYFDPNLFKGPYTRSGIPLKIGNFTTEHDVVKVFGEPFWIDRSDGMVIMFYEYQAGAVELVFMFYDGKNLDFILLCRNGALSDPVKRKEHGVTKPWPPQ